MRSVSLIFKLANPVKWNDTPKAQQATTTVCARSGQLMKSKSKCCTPPILCLSVVMVSPVSGSGLNVVFTPKSEKMYLIIESPWRELSMSPLSLTSGMLSPKSATSSYQ